MHYFMTTICWIATFADIRGQIKQVRQKINKLTSFNTTGAYFEYQNLSKLLHFTRSKVWPLVFGFFVFFTRYLVKHVL